MRTFKWQRFAIWPKIYVHCGALSCTFFFFSNCLCLVTAFVSFLAQNWKTNLPAIVSLRERVFVCGTTQVCVKLPSSVGQRFKVKPRLRSHVSSLLTSHTHMRAVKLSTLTCFCSSSPPLDLQKVVNKPMKDPRTSSSIPGSRHWALMLPQGVSHNPYRPSVDTRAGRLKGALGWGVFF